MSNFSSLFHSPFTSIFKNRLSKGGSASLFRLIGIPTIADVGVVYLWTPGVKNGVAPINFMLIGDLPDGLIFDTGTGTISGTPTKAFSGSITIDATDGADAEASLTRTLTVNATVPAAPTDIAATAGNAEATVAFVTPDDGGSEITGYTVTSDPGGLMNTGTVSPITVTGLTNDIEYTFTVTATNAVGMGPASAASNVVTPIATTLTDQVRVALFSNGERGGMWDMSRLPALSQDMAGTVPVTVNGEPIGHVADLSENDVPLVAADDADRAMYTSINVAPDPYALFQSGDALAATFGGSLGSNATVAYRGPYGAPVILTGQSIGATWTLNVDSHRVLVVDRALTPEETALVESWLTELLSADAVFDIYVDSNALPGGDGSLAAPFNTIAAAQLAAITFGHGVRVGLARGSYWREQLFGIGSGLDDVTIGAYGYGPQPTLDGADVASSGGWTPHDTYAGVYQRVWATDWTGGQFYLSLWEDGQRVRWVNSAAALDAAASGFYCAHVTAGTTTVYYKAVGAGNPASNGKMVEISRRLFSIASDANRSGWTVEDVHTRRQLHNDGSIVLAGLSHAMRRVLAEDGTKHNVYISRDCVAEDSVAWLCDWPERSNSTSFVGHAADGRGHGVTFRRCVVVNALAQANYAVNANKGLDGFYAHTGGAGVKFDSIEYEDCSAYGVGSSGMSGGNAVYLSNLRGYVKEFGTAMTFGADESDVVDCFIDGRSAMTGANVANRFFVPTANRTFNITGLRTICQNPTSGGVIWANQPCTVNVEKSVLFRESGNSGGISFLSPASAGSVWTLDKCIAAGSTSTGRIQAVENYANVAGVSYTPDNNVYWDAGIRFTLLGTTYTTFDSYRAANPAMDVNSLQADPLFVDPANGNFNLLPGSPAIALGAGLERPNIRYTPVPETVQLKRV